MATLHLTSNAYFLYCDTIGSIAVSEYTDKLDDVSLKSKAPWKFTGNVGPNQPYKALEVFGVIFQGKKLEELANDLRNSRSSINREGYSFLREKDCITQIRKVFQGEMYLRLNDLFPWSKYGVTVPTITTVWNRMDHNAKARLVNYEVSISELQNKLHQKDNEVRDYKSKLTNLETENTKYKKDLKEKEKIIEEHEKDKQQAELKSKMEELSICKKDSEKTKKLLEAKNKELLDLKAELYDIMKKLEEKNKVVKDEELANLHNQVLSTHTRIHKVNYTVTTNSLEAFNDMLQEGSFSNVQVFPLDDMNRRDNIEEAS